MNAGFETIEDFWDDEAPALCDNCGYNLTIPEKDQHGDHCAACCGDYPRWCRSPTADHLGD